MNNPAVGSIDSDRKEKKDPMPENKLSESDAARIEMLKLELERAKYRADVVKWIVIAVGAIISFLVIDWGRLKLEELRLRSDIQLRLIDAYAKATETAEPEIWKRKLNVLRLMATDERLTRWVDGQIKYIDEFAALDALYRETLKTASQLVDPARINEPERQAARRRFEQLYWADLPFANEPNAVEEGMIALREGLEEAEANPTDREKWNRINSLLIQLSKTFRGEIRRSRDLVGS